MSGRSATHIVSLVKKAAYWLAFALTISLLVPSWCAEDKQLQQGYWYFPRGGPYVLGFEHQPGAQLWVDGKKVAPCGKPRRGESLCRHVFAPGIYGFELKAKGSPPRLLWHPPGRRGPAEYVPDSSLSRDAAPTSFSRPGTFWPGGLTVGFILLFWLAAWAIRFPWRDVGQRKLALGACVFVVALGLRLWGIGDAGQTWDEDVNWSAGRNYVQNIVNGDFAEEDWRANFEHPPVTKYWLGLWGQFGDGYQTARFGSALVGSLACLFLFFGARRLMSEQAALVCGGVACFLPHLIGHSQVAGHESLSVMWWALGFCLSTGPGAGESKRSWIIMGVVVGLAVASRFTNGLLAVAMVGTMLARIAAETDWSNATAKARLGKVLGLGVAIGLPVTFATLVVVWPRLWYGPFSNLSESLEFLNRKHGLEPFLGTMTDSPPWYYFFTYWWATTPLLVIFGFAGGVITSGIKRHWYCFAVCLLWMLTPHIIAFSPVKQDGMRYVLPTLLGTALGVGLCFEWVQDQLHMSWQRLAIAAALAVYLFAVNLNIRPYYLDYYGIHVGGTRVVAKHKNFEVAWWGEGLDKGISYINDHAAPNAKVHKACVAPSHLAWLRHDLWPGTRSPSRADWMLVYAPQFQGRACKKPENFKLAYKVVADGAPLVYVYKRRKSSQ